jgi:hypothetical protein
MERYVDECPGTDEDLQSRTGLGDRDAKGIVRVILQAVEDATSPLVTRDHLDAEMQKLRAEMHQSFRSQTTWLMATMLAVGGFVIAAVKFIP